VGGLAHFVHGERQPTGQQEKSKEQQKGKPPLLLADIPIPNHNDDREQKGHESREQNQQIALTEHEQLHFDLPIRLGAGPYSGPLENEFQGEQRGVDPERIDGR
jgi:hypothetical protein